MSTGQPRLKGKRIVILAEIGMHEHEFWVPYYRFKEEGALVKVAGIAKGIVHRSEGVGGTDGCYLAKTELEIKDLRAGDWDALHIPGGIYGPMTLREYKPLLKFVQEMDRKKKVIAAICHGQWVLISSGSLKGRTATAPSDIVIDIVNAGARYSGPGAVRDGNLVTGEYFGELPAFMKLLLAAIEDG
jgi:protease I